MKYASEIEQFVRKYGKLYVEHSGSGFKSGVQGGVSSGHPVELPDLSGLKISEADRAMLGVLSTLMESHFSSQSARLDKMKDEIIAEIQRGSATEESRGNKG